MKIVRVLKKSPNETRVKGGTNFLWSPFIQYKTSKKFFLLFLQAYPSLKPLASWTRDLMQRVEHFDKWATTARPPVIFWMSAFTFPTGFLTAVLQTCARQNNVRFYITCCYTRFI